VHRKIPVTRGHRSSYTEHNSIHLCMYVCIYACMYVCIYDARVYVWIHSCIL